MSDNSYKYIIVGGGLAGGSAAAGIRQVDERGSILLIGEERYRPYDRPPLTKQLWSGKKTIDKIYLKDQEFYDSNAIKLRLGTTVVSVDERSRTVVTEAGDSLSYEKLLLATGGRPKRLSIPGGDAEGLFYYRTLDDYTSLRALVSPVKTALVIGGGFIGSEIAAALTMNGVDVTMVYPEPFLVSRVFPEGLGRALQDKFREKGIKILSGDVPVSLEKNSKGYVTETRNGNSVESDIVVVGVGISPSAELAEQAGLDTGDGITVDGYLQTSSPNVYAAGDSANFPYQALGKRMRLEHWDNAINQGEYAGRNMAGARALYDYMPYFFSDLFEFGYEAVGDVDARLETVADWQKENDTGVIYYLADGKVRGAMMCNVWDQVPSAREIIKSGHTISPGELRGAIR